MILVRMTQRGTASMPLAKTILSVVALLLFVLAAFNVSLGNINLIAAGLACWILAALVSA